MPKVSQFLEDEPNFLDWGKTTSQIFMESDLPQFHRDMYRKWFEYSTTLISHLQNNPNHDPSAYKAGLGGNPPETEGQNQVLVELQNELKKYEAGASPLLAAHLNSLRELLRIEESTNSDLIEESSWE